MQIFEPFSIKNLKLRNRIVMPPMCMYSSDNSGQALDFHRTHYASRATGGTGLIIQEATAVVPSGRISENDLGIWSDQQIEGLASVVDLIHISGARAGIQLAHAGRKCEVPDSVTVAPSGFHFSNDYNVPHELEIDEIEEIIEFFRQAAIRAARAGYDVLEIHGAHGYLIHEFLSPLSNRRQDRYGGELKNRTRFLKEVISAVRQVWPHDKVLQLRLSASDFLEGGIDLQDTISIVEQVKQDVDIFHLSSGGLLPAGIKPYPGYQTVFAEAVRRACHVPTIAVGLITRIEQAEEIIAAGRADLVALGRELLRNPYWPIRHCGLNQSTGCPIPVPYQRAWK
jgi:NADPH2 dehydrogenase